MDDAPFVPLAPMPKLTRAEKKRLNREAAARRRGDTPAVAKPNGKKPAKLGDLFPVALQRIAEDLRSRDKNIRQRAYKLVIEYELGKPTQKHEVDVAPIIVYHSAAIPPGGIPTAEEIAEHNRKALEAASPPQDEDVEEADFTVVA